MNTRLLDLLKAVVNLPTAPYHEQYVDQFINQWVPSLDAGKLLTSRRDRAGNIYLQYYYRPRSKRKLVFEAHSDHPGFVSLNRSRKGQLKAVFRGGVRYECFAGGRARFWLPESSGTQHSLHALPHINGRWIPAEITSVMPGRQSNEKVVQLAGVDASLPPGSIGMWDIPDARVKRDILYARACDDLAGVAAALAALEELVLRKARTSLTVLITRAEEVGFAGSLAAIMNHEVEQTASVIGLETSSLQPESPQGGGPVVRVGDKTSIFSDRLTRFIGATAADLAYGTNDFYWQRRLMHGGTCDTTAFQAFGYDAAGICLALGNYHNMCKPTTRISEALRGGPHIAAETINVNDFSNLVTLLVAIAESLHKYNPDASALKSRLSKMYRQDQRRLLFAHKLNKIT
ncbi:MAG: M20/M25/M40 family metallo-hydrolase [Phycisphaerales bacterium]|nr:M20/M25/M40 family metallo-hydrolase [Phycisphaerales bacterium]